MDTDFLYALLIGIIIMLAIYLALSRVVTITNVPVKRALALFAAAIGLLSVFWLDSHPDILREYAGKIVLAGLAVVLALLAFARRSLHK